MLSPLFISHGAPSLVIENSDARRFLESYGRTLKKPRAIVIASAHFTSGRPTVNADAQPGMIYDFGGFAPELYQMVYPAPGDPLVATKVAGLLDSAGLAPAIAPSRGYDHGAWVPLMLLYPDADVPVVEISVQPHQPPVHHFEVGRALASLREEDILVIGSGSATHNLHEYFGGGYRPDATPPAWVAEFGDWLRTKIEAGAVADLLAYRRLARYAAENHPTDEHLLPLFIALGAAGAQPKGRRIHSSNDHGVLMMDAYAFE